MTAHALYRFFDSGGDLLYVGITMDPASRWQQHRLDKPWWSLISTITVETHPSRKAVLAAERVAIHTELPRFNLTHSRVGWSPRTIWPAPKRATQCPACRRTTEPVKATPQDDGVFALYECCRWTWQKTWPLAIEDAA